VTFGFVLLVFNPYPLYSCIPRDIGCLCSSFAKQFPLLPISLVHCPNSPNEIEMLIVTGKSCIRVKKATYGDRCTWTIHHDVVFYYYSCSLNLNTVTWENFLTVSFVGVDDTHNRSNSISRRYDAMRCDATRYDFRRECQEMTTPTRFCKHQNVTRMR
jgi:hypothetical protein